MALAVLRKLKRKPFQRSDAARFAREIRKEKNAGSAAFLVCAFLDNSLKIAIYTALPNKVAAEKLFEDWGPLDNFSAKIATGHALGLYGNQTRRNLDILREIRNLFAHDVTLLTFATPEIAQACQELEIPDAPRHVPVPKLRTEGARDRYIVTGVGIALWVFMNSLGTLWEGEAQEIRPVALP
jgi:hypothetical protein